MKIGKLSLTDVIDLAEDMEKVYGPLHNEFDKDEKLYELDFKAELCMPDQYKSDGLVLSTGRDMVDTYCNHTNISNASVKATRKGDGIKSEEEEKTERHFGAGVMYMTNLDAEVSPWWDCAKHYWLHGMGVLKVVYVSDAEFPLKIMAVNPYNVRPDPDPRSTDFVIEVNEYHFMKAKLRYPFWDNPEGRGLTDKGVNVRHISFWSETQHMEIVDKKSVIKTKSGIDNHGYGVLPYIIFNSGLGYMSKDGDMSKRYVGILRYVHDLLIAESSSFSVNHVVLKKAAWPKKALKGPIDVINSPQVRVTDDYGEVDKIPEGVEVHEYQHAVAPPESMQHFANIHSLLSEHGAPRTMQGVGEEGVRSGSDRRLLMAQGEKRLAQCENTFKHRTEKVLETCAKIFVNKVPDKITVWTRDNIASFDTVIDKKKMKEPFNYNVVFSPVSWEDEYRRQDSHIRLLNGRIYDQTKVWDEMPNVDTDDMMERMERQRLMDDPMINQVISQALGMLTQSTLSKKLGTDELFQIAKEQGGNGNGQGQGPYGNNSAMPPMGGMTQNVRPAVMPGGPQDMQNQMRGLRSPNAMNANQGQGGGGERGVNR